MKIFYGICGEGMGHGGRSLALVERLVALGHRVTIFTFADAFRLLTSAGYEPVRIAGLQFRQAPDGGVDAIRSFCNFYHYLGRRRESLDRIRQAALVDRPDLFITDFEPLVTLAAASLRLPCVSVDNQHRFCHPLGSDFPIYLQAYSRLAGEFVRRWIKRPRGTVRRRSGVLQGRGLHGRPATDRRGPLLRQADAGRSDTQPARTGD